MRIEKVVFNNLTFTRYPESESRSSATYFKATVKGMLTYLHREVWIYYNKSIPEGCHIHHKFENDYATVDPNRLECLTAFEHRSLHAKRTKGMPKTDRQKEAMRKGRLEYLKHQTPEQAAALGSALSSALTGRKILWQDKITKKLNTPEVKAKISEASKGRIWISNGHDCKMIKSSEIPDGWHKGRK